jgi:hypothetical protein
MVKLDLMSDFEQYGINVLPKEACAYGQRLLCDVNRDGIRLLEDYFLVQIVFTPNWNSRVGDKPAIGSIMLPRGVFWKGLAEFIIWHVEKCDYMVEEGSTVIGLKKDDEHCGDYLKLYAGKVRRNRRKESPRYKWTD